MSVRNVQTLLILVCKPSAANSFQCDKTRCNTLRSKMQNLFKFEGMTSQSSSDEDTRGEVAVTQ